MENKEKMFVRFHINNLPIELKEKMQAFKLTTNTNYSRQLTTALRMYFAVPENLEKLKIGVNKEKNKENIKKLK
jgi:hypothetical protein